MTSITHGTGAWRWIFPFALVAPIRTPLRRLSSWRILRGGRVGDLGRLPRYLLLLMLALGGVWGPIVSYLSLTPPSFSSSVSLILPGAGASATVNLTEIGQASSSANSAFASSKVSPTQTYKRLLSANRVLLAAATPLGLELTALGKPQIKLVDETSLIHFEMTGPSAEAAQARASALLRAFLDELERLREDERRHRAATSDQAIAGYRDRVQILRYEIGAVQEASGLVSFDHYRDLVTARDDLRTRLTELAAERREADESMARLAAELGTDAETAALVLQLAADTGIREMAETLAEAEAHVAQLRGRFGRRHPQVTSAVGRAERAEGALIHQASLVTGRAPEALPARLDLAPDTERSALLARLVEMGPRCEGLRAREAALTARLAEKAAEIDRLAPAAAELDDLTRDYQVAEAVFASAMARTDTSKAEAFASYPLVQVLEDASLPERPTSPRPKIAIAAGVAGTLMFAMALTLAWLRRPLIERILARDPA